jgi:hypothetical protein
VHESIRDAIRRIRRDALKRRWIAEPPPPTCEVCGHSVAYVPLIMADRGEEDCQACRETRTEYQRRHHPGGAGVAVVRITRAPSRAELEARSERISPAPSDTPTRRRPN